MKQSLMKQVANFINEHRQKNRWKQVVTVLAALVVFATTYSMILPAITMTGLATASNCETSSNAATNSNSFGSGGGGSYIASGSNTIIATGSDALIQTPSNAILYRCGLEEHLHGDECENAESILICELEEHEHVDKCYYPEEFTLEMIEYMDAFVEGIKQLPDLDVVREYKILEAQELFEEADVLLADEMGINLEEGIYPYDVVEIMIGRALESYTAALDLFIAEYPELSADEFDAILADDYIYGPAYEDLKGFIEVWYGAVTLATAGKREDDLVAVENDGIDFKLFNYSNNINKTDDGTAWRPISQYFTFRTSYAPNEPAGNTDGVANYYVPNPTTNTTHDVDGFPINHATVERILGEDEYPVLDLTRNADGTARPATNVSEEERSLSYLFSTTKGPVTAYDPENTILRKSGTEGAEQYHYIYDSKQNAIDYDASEGENVFRIRSYKERSDTTAGYGDYYDFIPFNYTDGTIMGNRTDNGYSYNLLGNPATGGNDGTGGGVDYWFGMTMEFEFFQTKDGKIGEDEMVFNFSGDDDVWVFVDDVLVLDLGGTHGTVDGSINFATGEIRQYLSWQGANSTTTDQTTASNDRKSYPTTLKECFNAAKYVDADNTTKSMVPNGGWDGGTFADYTKHTLKFFYLERGSGVANCTIDFRLQPLPAESLTVTKELTTNSDDPELNQYVEDTLSYKYRVMKVNAEGNVTDELFIKPGTEFKLTKKDGSETTGTVAADGTFSLKANESAQFTEMLLKGDGTKEYVVQELMPTALNGQYANVEYSVGGDMGSTQTGENPPANFSAYETEPLSAESSQTVTYRNKIDVNKLSQLKITKALADGAQFAAGKLFDIQVKLGDQLLPVGTTYEVNGTNKTVSEAGIIQLGIGETATIVEGILSGTEYEITERIPTGELFIPTYSGVVTKADGTVNVDVGVNVDGDGASGEFPLASTVHVTVTNADYQHSITVPISKGCIDNDTTGVFNFEVAQVTYDTWEVIKTMPGGSITVPTTDTVPGNIVIGFRTADEDGTYYFKISEKRGTGDYIYDTTFFIVEVKVQTDTQSGTRTAEVVRMLKNGTEQINGTLPFTNRKTTSLLVSKTVNGINANDVNIPFEFSVEVKLNEIPFDMSHVTTTAGLSVDEDHTNIVTFALRHGETQSIPGIPYGANVIVKETKHDGFVAHYKAGSDGTDTIGDTATVVFGNSQQQVFFTNYTGQELPSTGGMGTYWFTFGGLLLAVTAMIFGFVQRRRRERRAN